MQPLPAVALSFIGLGLVFRDGVAVILGLLRSGVALVAISPAATTHG